jgi:hypothetical protein
VRERESPKIDFFSAMEKKNEQYFYVLSYKKCLFIFYLDAKEAKNQEFPYEIAAHHSLLIFHA